MRKFVLLILFFITVISYGQSAGKLVRQGNRQYNDGNYDEAELRYREALGKSNELPQAFYNLGNTDYRQQEFANAVNRYGEAIKNTDDPKKLTGYYYNMGNALYSQEKLEASIEAYKNALRYDSENADAKHNLSLAWLKLNMQKQQQNQNENSKPPEPSEFAKKLKLQAQALVNEHRYAEAYNLMIEGEKKDQTVSYFKDFTNKIKEVDEINTLKP